MRAPRGSRSPPPSARRGRRRARARRVCPHVLVPGRGGLVPLAHARDPLRRRLPPQPGTSPVRGRARAPDPGRGRHPGARRAAAGAAGGDRVARRRRGRVLPLASRRGRQHRPVRDVRARPAGRSAAALRVRHAHLAVGIGDRARGRARRGAPRERRLRPGLPGRHRLHGTGDRRAPIPRAAGPAVPRSERARLPGGDADRRAPPRPPRAVRHVGAARRVLREGLSLDEVPSRLAGARAVTWLALRCSGRARLQPGAAPALLALHPHDERALGLLQRIGAQRALAGGRAAAGPPLPRRPERRGTAGGRSPGRGGRRLLALGARRRPAARHRRPATSTFVEDAAAAMDVDHGAGLRSVGAGGGRAARTDVSPCVGDSAPDGHDHPDDHRPSCGSELDPAADGASSRSGTPTTPAGAPTADGRPAADTARRRVPRRRRPAHGDARGRPAVPRRRRDAGPRARRRYLARPARRAAPRARLRTTVEATRWRGPARRTRPPTPVAGARPR